MKILLSDASSLTSRQVATILHRKGHEVHVLNSSGSFLVLTNLTNCVARVHRVPAFGKDPYVWLDAAIKIIEDEKTKELKEAERWDFWGRLRDEQSRGRRGKGFDILIVTQEQVAVVSAERARIERTGIKVAVPSFAELSRVMGKRSARDALREAELDQPESLLPSEGGFDLESAKAFLPGYVKTDIGTASRGVRRVATIAEVQAAASELKARAEGKLLLQKEISGNLIMISAIFAHSRLLAWHACLRAHRGPGGGASKKVSLPLPIIEGHLTALGEELSWHGALSADAILSDGRVWYIDINPRICEPVNAWLAGTDMVQALLDVSLGHEREWDVVGRRSMEGVETHQLLLGFMGAAERGRGALLAEVFMAMMRFERYAGSREELLPFSGDWFWSLFVLTTLVLILFVGGTRAVDLLTGGTVGGYALEEEGWEMILRREEVKRREGLGKARVRDSGSG